MSTLASGSALAESPRAPHAVRPSFFGLVGGELFKIRRQLTTWIMVVVLAGLIFLPYLIALAEQRVTTDLSAEPANFLGNWASLNLILLRAVSGFILIILTARVIGLEYNLGTIRIILARGVGRLQLLLAKLTAVVIWAISLLLLGLVLNALLGLLLIQVKAGNLNALQALDSSFWQNQLISVGTVAISMGATILLATAFTVVGRSLAFGMSLALVWFPLDNILVGVLALVARLTNNTFWSNITPYLLGPNLNVMSSVLTNKPDSAFGAVPLVAVDRTHTLVVTIIYAAIFAVVALVLTARRDVKE